MHKNDSILMLVENISVPADPRVWAEATALRDAGFTVNVICPKGAAQHRESYVCMDGIHIYRYASPALSSRHTAYIVEYAVALWRTFLLSLKVQFRAGFAVIHAANPPDMFFLLGLFYRLFGKKFVFDQHDLAPKMFQVIFAGRMKLLYRLLLLLEWCSYKTAHLVLVTNLSQKQHALACGKQPSEVFVVRNGPDTRLMQTVSADPSLKGERPYLLAYIGAMGVQDGVEYALFALSSLVYQRGRRDVSLVLMGDGECIPALRKLAHRLHLDDFVRFTGWVSHADIARYLAVTDVGLCPDPQNGLNEFCTMIKTMEYMALGRPVVAFDLMETRFTAHNAALYATPNDVEDFADKIEMLLDNAELRRHLGTAGRRRIEEKLSWEHMREHLLLAYHMLLPGHQKLKKEAAGEEVLEEKTEALVAESLAETKLRL